MGREVGRELGREVKRETEGFVAVTLGWLHTDGLEELWELERQLHILTDLLQLRPQTANVRVTHAVDCLHAVCHLDGLHNLHVCHLVRDLDRLWSGWWWWCEAMASTEGGGCVSEGTYWVLVQASELAWCRRAHNTPVLLATFDTL